MHANTNRLREGERAQTGQDLFIILFFSTEREKKENIWRIKKGIKREAWSGGKGEGEHLGYLKALIQPWAGLDGCREAEVLTLHRSELQGSCRRWMQQLLLHRQYTNQLKLWLFFHPRDLMITRNRHRPKQPFPPHLNSFMKDFAFVLFNFYFNAFG